VVGVIAIRPATSGELVGLARFVVDAYRQFSADLTAENWEAMQRGLTAAVRAPDPGIPLVALDGGAVAGFVVYFPPGASDKTLFAAEWASVRLLAVDPARRGRGIGGALMEECIARARQDGARVMGLHTSELMATARAMYERMGFEVVRELPRRLGVRYWVFRLHLPDAAGMAGD